MNILFLVPYPLKESPSQRFRFEQYLPILERNGHQFHIQSFLDNNNWRMFAGNGSILFKFVMLANGLLRRTLILFRLSRYDIVFIHREAAPLGPPIFEWMIAKIFRKRIIYDFDDAIWLTDRQSESPLLKILKWRSKVKTICEWSLKVSCGNHFLQRYALQFNQNAIYNPTTIDTEELHFPDAQSSATKRIVIGWTGSSSTVKYLVAIEKILFEIENMFPQVDFLVIADEKPKLKLSRLEFRRWDLGSEISDLRNIDIGIMPLPDDDWSRGKCGFKALQYMALEIPTIASRIGANEMVIDHGVDGFLVSSAGQWKEYCATLIRDSALRANMGKLARQKVINHYSVRSNAPTFLSLFD